MGKIIRFFLGFFLASALLFAGGLEDRIESLNKSLSSSSKDEVFRIHNSLRNIYVKTIISEDKKLQKKTIEGLIKSSKILGLKYDHYEEELKLLDKEIKPQKKSKQSASKNFKTNKKTKIPYIKNISAKKNVIVITFSAPLSKNALTFFELNRKNRYKDIFDLKTNLFFKVKPIKLNGIKRVKVAQNCNNLVRIVLEDNKPINSIFSIEKNKVLISITKNKKKGKTSKKFKTTKRRIFNKVIVIDPGHGGKDPGAIGYKKKKEKNAVLKISLYLGKELKKRGYKVYYTRSRDNFIGLRNRTKIANSKKADIFLSLHANAAHSKSKYLSHKGIETYFLSPARSKKAKRVAEKENMVDMKGMDYFSKQTFLNFLNREKIIASNKLAIDIQQGILSNLRKKYKVVDGGVREAPFWVLLGAQMPSILIEIGYITNPTEAKRMFNPFYQKLLAKGIADGIDGYFLKNK